VFFSGFVKLSVFLSNFRFRARMFLHDERFGLLFSLYNGIAGFLRNECAQVLYQVGLMLQLPWPRAYLWRSSKLAQKLHRLIESDIYTKSKADRYFFAAAEDLEYLKTVAEYSEKAARLLADIALVTGRMGLWLSSVLVEYDHQERRAQRAGGAALGFRVLEPSFPILVTVGNTMHLDGYLKAAILGLRTPTRTVLLLHPWLKRFVVNPCLLDYWRPFIDVIEDESELEASKSIIDSLAFNLHGATPCGGQVVPFSISSVVLTQRQWVREGREPLLRLTSDHHKRGFEEIQKWGIAPSSWFVTLHVRGGLNKGAEAYRDSFIESYLESCETITAAGGWVIRMGDASMEALPPMENTIDYAHYSSKSDWMDVFLCAAAKFMIGTSSGLTCVSYSFGVPIAMTNCLPTATIYLSSQDMFLPRLMRQRADGTPLQFSQLMGLPYSMGISDGMYKNVFGVETIANTSDEINDLVKEMLDYLSGTVSYSVEDQVLQQRFKTITANRETLVGLGGMELPSRIGRHFLNKHKHLLD